MPETLTRRFELRADSRGETYAASLSSEAPVERDFGTEVLDHSPQAIDLSRARNGLPLLFNHDLRQLVGRVEGVGIVDKRLRGALKFFDTAAGRDARTAVDAGHREVSVSYEVLSTRPEAGGVVRVTRWRPYEASVVSVPADASVGIGRSAPNLERLPMSIEHDSPPEAMQGETLSRSQRRAITVSVAASQAEADERVNAERERVSNIIAVARDFSVPDDMRRQAIESGMSWRQFGQGAIEMQRQRSENIRVFNLPAASFGSSDGPSPQEREWSALAGNFSVSRALMAAIDPAAYMRSAGREAEASRELARRSPLPTSGTMVPIGAFFAPMLRAHQRSLSVGTDTAGGHTVQTMINPALFADALRARMITGALGARVLPGLSDTVVIPRKTATTTAAWLTEVGTASSSDPAFDQLTLSPKRIGAYTDLSKQLIVQSSLAMEQVVLHDLSETIMVELDRVAMLGTGASNQPRGVINTSGTGAVVGGANGAQVSWSHVLDLERAVAAANAQVSLQTSGYAINPATRGWLKRTLKVSGVGTPLIMGDDAIDDRGLTSLNSYRCGVSTLLPSNGTKGSASSVCSTIIFGDWSQLFIGLFGGAVELIVDPYTLAPAGQVRINANLFADVAVRYAASFAAMTDALTA